MPVTVDPVFERKLKSLQGAMNLLTVSGQSKTAKSLSAGVITAVLHLLPAGEYDAARVRLGLAPLGVNLCPFAGECRGPCLNTAGKGGIPMASYAGGAFLNNVQKGRYRKTDLYFTDRDRFTRDLRADLRMLAAFAGIEYDLALRLNGTSDVDFQREAPEMIALALSLGFEQYDYTKRPIHFDPSAPVRLVYSLDAGAARKRHALRYLADGGTVAIVFDVKGKRPLPATWNGYPVIDGDLSDLRSRDPAGVVVGLRTKGAARKLKPGGFVQPVG
jgi:hypothetical protein